MVGHELGFLFLDVQACRHGKQTDVVVLAALVGSRRDKVGQRTVGSLGAIDHGTHALHAQRVPGHQDFAARFVAVDLDGVVVDRVGRVQPDHAMGGQPAAFDQLFEHGLGIGVDTGGLGPHDLVGQDGREGAGQVPGLEKGRPVDEGGQLGQVVVLEHAAPQELRGLGGVLRKIDQGLVGAGFGQGHQGCGLLVGVLQANGLVVAVELIDVGSLALTAQQVRAHPHRARRIGHVDHGA